MTLLEALQTAVKIADEAREEWDKAPAGMRAGKLLIALSGHLKGYRPDIDAIHAALRRRPETEEVAYWRRDAIARLQMAIWLHRGCELRGQDDRAADVRVSVIRPTLAALDDADAGEWYERCEICREFMRDGEARLSLGEDGGAAHAKCASDEPNLSPDVKDDDATAVIAEARTLLGDTATAPASDPPGEGSNTDTEFRHQEDHPDTIPIRKISVREG